MLKLQSRYSKNIMLADLFSKAIFRINSVAQVHQELYRSKNLDKIDCGEYIRRSVNQVAQNVGWSKNIEIFIETDKISLDINSAIPFGIILNEIVSNAFNHAFSESNEGKIYVSFKKGRRQKRELIVKDNGAGMAPDIDIWDTPTVGYKIVTMLVEQIDGTISVTNKSGTIVKIEF